ncbi:hypothetical protein C6501_15125 [Candidatus Poribacteria bacterium]|nr:MAG: hypothetical protein C6501_15125 [Candidatus Poribacteria bacterium]
MKKDDVALIHRILADDETAFTELVKKYQKPVHALAWRKVGDFHIAEDITQDTFLKVYQRLHTLKDPNQFSGWLYVITTNLCNTWHRKKRVRTQPLEDVETTMTPKDAYSQHVTADRATTAAETQREVVKTLLAKLKESERTVMTLHYLGEMTVEEISRFLGVSGSTIKSRLRRARQRLQKEETMIREALDHFQISPNLTDNIMREVAQLKPTPSVSKPLVPWIAAASSVVLIVLMLGLGSKYLARFQQPYSLDAQTEMTVELIDAPIVLNVDAKPDVRREFGNPNTLGKNDNSGQKPDEILLSAAQSNEEGVSAPKQQWIQENSPVGSGELMTLLPTPEGEIYIVYDEGWEDILYKLPVDGTEWQPICDISSLLPDIPYDAVSMVKWNDTLYIVVSVGRNGERNELFASMDDGETWDSFGRCPAGWVFGFEEMNDTFYLALENEIFVSEDIGKTWNVVDEGLTGEVNTLEVIQNTLFAATTTGLYHLDGGSWQRLQFPVHEAKKIVSFVGTENNLYVLTQWDWENIGPQDRTWWLFRSTDKGQSWTDITPTNALPIMGSEPFKDLPEATLAAAKNTLLLIGWSGAAVVRSINNGNTWTLEKTTNVSLMPYSVDKAVAVDENTLYLQGESGMYRSIDGGISWTRFNPEMKGEIIDLICVKTSREHNTSGFLYAMCAGGGGGIYPGHIEVRWVFKSSDKGKSWHVVNPEVQTQEDIPSFTRIAESDGVLYAKGRGRSSDSLMSLYRISEDRNTLVPIKGMPVFRSSSLYNLLHYQQPAKGSDKSYFEQLQESSVGANQYFKQLAQVSSLHVSFRRLSQDPLYESGLRGPFAVSGNTFYLEYNFKLLRWEPGDTEWYNTGQEETVRLSRKIIERELKLAVSGDTVYVGKRDGHLVVSYDRGNNRSWIDLTAALPFPVETFKEIVFAGSTVYVATDAGVTASDNGIKWRAITDAEGTNLVMERLAADGTTVYGVTKGTGIYRLESGVWEKIISEIPDGVTSLTVDGNTLYVGTQNNGMLHFLLEE